MGMPWAVPAEAANDGGKGMTDQHTIESVMEEDRRFDPPIEFSENALVKSFDEYKAIYDE